MDNVKVEYTERLSGDVRISSKYPDNPVMITAKVNQIFHQLKENGFKVSDMKISFSFDNGNMKPNEETIIDRIDFDILTDHKYVEDSAMKTMLVFLSEHAYRYWNIDDTKKFISEFLEMYNGLEMDKKFIPPSDNAEFDLESEPLDINQYFGFHNISYEIRSIHGIKYQLIHQSKLYY